MADVNDFYVPSTGEYVEDGGQVSMDQLKREDAASTRRNRSRAAKKRSAHRKSYLPGIDDPEDYDANEPNYIIATDKHGHCAKVQVAFMPTHLASMEAVIGRATNDYESVGDYLRNASIHQLQYDIDEEIAGKVGVLTAQARVQARRERLKNQEAFIEELREGLGEAQRARDDDMLEDLVMQGMEQLDAWAVGSVAREKLEAVLAPFPSQGL